jgi:putative hydrolase of the HAD superfamily
LDGAHAAAHNFVHRNRWIERRRNEQGFGGTPVPSEVTTPTFCFATLGELADAVDAELAAI